MKLKALFLILSLAAACALPCGAKPVEVSVFTSPYCPHCRHMERDGFVEAFEAEHPDEVHISRYDVTQNGGNLIFMQAMEERGVKSLGIPAMVIGEEVLQGYPNSINRCEEVLARVLARQKKAVPAATPSAACRKTEADSSVKRPAEPVRQRVSVSAENAVPGGADSAAPAAASAEPDALRQRHEAAFSQITFWAVVGAGLADGVNPCAFAVIVFFISFLSVYKYNRKEIIVVGSAYCISVFAAYVLLGLGVFRFLYAMKGFAYVTLAVRWVTIALCALFFLLSLYDFWVYRRTKKSEKMLLQLPASYKRYIHRVMHFFLREKKGASWRLVAAACAVGFVVSLVEAVCTGQVYLPTIMVILKEADSRFFQAAEYLLLYNLMFIVPLAAVFVLALCGKESATFSGWLKKHLGLTKLLLCLVFLGLLFLML